MKDTLEWWHKLCEYWDKHDGIDRSIACLLLERCNSFISNSLTVNKLFCISNPINNIWRDTDGVEDLLIEKNEELLSGWKLVGNGGGIFVLDMFTVVTFILEKNNVNLLINIKQCGDTQVMYRINGKEECSFLTSDIDKFYSVFHRTNQ